MARRLQRLVRGRLAAANGLAGRCVARADRLMGGQHGGRRQHAVERAHGALAGIAYLVGMVLLGRVDFNGKADMAVLDDDARDLSSGDEIAVAAGGRHGGECGRDLLLCQFIRHS